MEEYLATKPKVIVRNWREKDIPAIVKLHEAVYGHVYSKAELYNKRKYRMQFKKFPEGQFSQKLTARS